MANVEMDHHAKQFIQRAQQQHFTPPQLIPKSKLGLPIITVKGNMITSALDTSLKQYVTGQDLEDWWIRKGRIKSSDIPRIDWNTIYKVMKESSWHRQKFIVKWVSKQLPVGIRLKKMNQQSHADCPRCGYHAESNKHIVQCSHRGNATKWTRALRDLDRWLRKIHTDPDIVRAIMLILPRWQQDNLNPRYCPTTVNNDVQKAVMHQHQLSWDNFMEGICSIHWSKCQDMYYKTKKRRNTGERWAIKVSKKIWDILKTLWDHRNSILHRSDGISPTGRTELYLACQLELNIGKQHLPDIFDIYFDTEIDELMEEPIQDIRSWYRTIRQAREASGWTYTHTISTELRRWAGIR